MSKHRSNRKKIEKKIAKSRIIKLFKMAEKCALSGKLYRADRYVHIARKISMKYLVSIPREYKKSYCKHCYSYLFPGITSRIRVKRGKIIIYCKNCKKFTRLPIKNK